MSQCPLCKDNVKAFEKPRAAHLVIHKDGSGHVHVHGDLDKKEDIKEMLEIAGEESGVTVVEKKQLIDIKEVIFHNKQRIGDMLVFTSAIRDFKAAFPHVRVNVEATAPHIWDHNPNIDRTLKPFYSDDLKRRADVLGKGPLEVATIEDFPKHTNVIKIGPGWLTNKSNSLDWHFTNAYRCSIEQALKVNIPQGESRPDIYLTEEEYNAPRVIANPYWIICVNGEKGWGCKMYPFTKWQAFVSQNPDITFVQIGTKEDNPPRLQGSNVIDFVGQTQDKQTGIRNLYKLFLNAEGSIGLVSFHMHLSGALQKPCLVIAGGREPVSFTRYAGHGYLSTDGMLPCAVKACWHCAIETCTNPVHRKDQNGNDEIVPKCVDIIPPERLTLALRDYYEGGRLVKGVPSQKPKFKNVVKTPAPIVVTEQKGDTLDKKYNTFGFTFGGGALLESDWVFIEELIKRHNIKTVLEFGSGLSTLLFHNAGVKVTSYETMPQWIERVKFIDPTIDIRHWDGKNLQIDQKYDLAFVDGPSGGHNREFAVMLSSLNSNMVIVHDGHGEFEKAWQERYLKGQFNGPMKNKGRCWLWIRPEVAPAEIVQPSEDLQGKVAIVEKVVLPEYQYNQSKVSKSIKIVTTARGWGGQARSIVTIMQLLINAGHRVEFIPFRNAVTSSELKAWLNQHTQVKVTENYDTIRETCDVLFMYGDDFIWEFKTPLIQEAFAEIGAERKIMMLNYRRGSVGETEWTKGWDKYMFLNSSQERELLKFLPGVKTKVLPPCTDLTPFLNIQPDYNHSLRIVRHSSQGDTKFDKEGFLPQVNDIIDSRADAELSFLPGPSFIQANTRIKKTGRTADPKVIANFLSKGNLFWYSLPKGYMDMGPRVILEAMAAGLPVLADNWGGAKDRVSRETGWLCDEKSEHVEIIKHVSVAELQRKGQAAKERARQEFVPERWVEEILG